MDELIKIFIYGTLKRGEYNEKVGNTLNLVYSHSALLHGYKIIVGYELPFLVPCSYGTVGGEIQTIPESLLPVLDEFEMPGWYERKLVTLVSGEEAYAYIAKMR